MTHQPDELIDRALQSLRDTQAPTNLEARIAARLAQVADARTPSASLFTPSPNRTSLRSRFAAAFNPLSSFAVILRSAATKDPRILLTKVPIYALAAAALLIATFLVFPHHQSTITIAHTNAQPLATPTQPFQPADQSSLAITQVSQGFSLGSHKSIEKAGVLTAASTNPDALALAETLAPTRPAPVMPLTAEEHLLILATRQGQPIQVAELDTLRQPILRAAAEAHQRAALRHYAQSLLAPLAAAEAYNSTSTPVAGDLSSQPPSSK